MTRFINNHGLASIHDFTKIAPSDHAYDMIDVYNENNQNKVRKLETLIITNVRSLIWCLFDKNKRQLIVIDVNSHAE